MTGEGVVCRYCRIVAAEVFGRLTAEWGHRQAMEGAGAVTPLIHLLHLKHSPGVSRNNLTTTQSAWCIDQPASGMTKVGKAVAWTDSCCKSRAVGDDTPVQGCCHHRPGLYLHAHHFIPRRYVVNIVAAAVTHLELQISKLARLTGLLHECIVVGSHLCHECCFWDGRQPQTFSLVPPCPTPLVSRCPWMASALWGSADVGQCGGAGAPCGL